MTKPQGDLNIPVTQIEISNGISSGIRLTSLANGLVPIHEEHEARLERNINLADWANMDRFEKALIVANRRIRNASQNLQAEAEILKMKRDAARKK